MRNLHRALTAAAVLAVLATVPTHVRGADNNVLRRDQGIVTYAAAGAQPRALEGSVEVGDTVVATTASASLATLQVLDSSEIRIGGLTTVRVGALRVAEASHPSSGTIFLERGAVRFNVAHLGGARASYTFITPTTQLAVRGTVGYFVHGPTGDQIYCVSCDEGDVSIATTGQSFALRSGQTLIVATQAGRVTGTAVVANRTINNPAIDQFLGGVSPFGEPATAGRDFTSSRSGP